MVEKNKLLSDLLDEKIQSNDLANLLDNDDISESWYRYHSVSAIIKDQHSANTSFDFCSQVSAKIADEPAIIAAPRLERDKAQNSTQPSNIHPIVAEFKRTGSGFAIAATVAVATFFSFQTLQVAQDGSVNDTQVASESSESNSIKIPNSAMASKSALGYELDANEQFDLDVFNDRYITDLRRSDKGSFAPVSGEFVRTVRFSAEEWQAILEKSLERQRKLEQAKQQQDKE